MSIEIHQVSEKISEPSIVNLAATNWYLVLLFMILGSIAVCLLLFMMTKNPKEWQHTSQVKEMQTTGRLKDLAESIKTMSGKQSRFLPVQGLIKRLFFEKVKSIRNLSDEEMQKLYKNDSETLQKYIKDKEIVEWLITSSAQRQQTSRFFRKEKTQDQTVTNLNRIVEKMEVWAK